jgi:LemA protein
LVVVIAFSTFLGSYNSLVDAEESVLEAKANIQTMLQRRADLIPNFVATVKGYTDYEQETLTAITEARAAVGRANNAGELADANEQLDRAVSIWVNAVTEAYPDLKANQNYIALQDELAGSENRIAVARKDYNDEASDYNASIRKFPKKLIAGLFGFEKVDYFEASAGAENVPNVSFD